MAKKKCKRCDAIKSTDAFYWQKTRLSSWCKDCHREEKKKHRANRLAVGRTVEVSESRCTKCGTTKPAEKFSKNPHNKSGLSSWCKACSAKSSRKRYVRKKPDKIRGDGHQWCNKCKNYLPPNEFTTDSQRTTGLYPTCKECVKENRERIKSKRRGMKKPKEKKCASCKIVKASSHFCENLLSLDGLFGFCNQCMANRMKKWLERPGNEARYKTAAKRYRMSIRGIKTRRARDKRRRQLPHVQAYYRAYQTSPRMKKWRQQYHQSEQGKAARQRAKANRRAKEAAMVNTLTAAEWKQLQEEHNHCCFYCGVEFDGEKYKATRDHLIPIAKGGDNTKENVVPACGSCNSRKWMKPADQFLKELSQQ